MAEDKEMAFPIDSFAGVNRNADRENIGANQFYQLQNLWERRLGALETRNGSLDVLPTVPTNVGTYDQIFKLYKPIGTNPRVISMNSLGLPVTSQSSTLPSNITLQFNNDATGWWNHTHTFSATTYSFTHTFIIVRLVGYCTDISYRIPVTSITGYSAATLQNLEVKVTSALPAGVTGIEILAVINCGTTITPATVTIGGAYQYRTMWVGFIPMDGLTTSDTIFKWAPYGLDVSMTTPITIGQLKMTYTISGLASGGTLQAGKTYYVLVTPQFGVFSTSPRASYRSPGINTSTDIVPITIPAGGSNTGSIVIFGMSPLAVCFLVSVGENAQLMQPIAIYNDSATTNASVTISSLPSGNPGVMGINNTNSTSSITSSDVSFNFSNYSKMDTLGRLDDAGVLHPVFCGNMYALEGAYWDTFYDQYGWTVADPTNGGRQYIPDMVTGAVFMEAMGIGNRCVFAPWQGLALFVNNSSTTSNYFVTDGNVAAPVVPDFQSQTQTARQTLPNSHYISVYQGSVVIGGGTPSVDPNNGGKLDSSRKFYFSRAANFSDFTIAGAAAPVLAFLPVDNGENINGFGSWTNTSSQVGPLAQFVISNKNGLWLLDNIPTFDAKGNLGEVSLRLLSRKVGSVGQNVFAYTPIGTIITGYEGVFVIRDNGEPTPIGQSLIDILRGANFEHATACYHDKHYKISFYHPDYGVSFPPFNNVEFWLDINKMIQNKGAEDWVGPMVGRRVLNQIVEDRDGDLITNGIPRDRYVISNTVVYKADVEPGVTDSVINDVIGGVTTPVTTIMETRDMPISRQDDNFYKLLKRWYWRIRTNLLVGAPLAYTDNTWIDGALVDTQSRTAFSASTLNFRDQSFFATRVFPLTRLRGRTFRKQITTAQRVAYNGFQINYEIEKRRI